MSVSANSTSCAGHRLGSIYFSFHKRSLFLTSLQSRSSLIRYHLWSITCWVVCFWILTNLLEFYCAVWKYRDAVSSLLLSRSEVGHKLLFRQEFPQHTENRTVKHQNVVQRPGATSLHGPLPSLPVSSIRILPMLCRTVKGTCWLLRVSLSNAPFSDILSDTFQLPQSPCTLTPHLNSSSPLGHFQHTLPLLQFMNSLKVTRLFFISQGKLSLLSIPQFLEKPVSYILSCLRYLAWKNKSSLFTPCCPEVPVGHWVVTD